MSNRVSTPFPVFNDKDGSPLSGGSIFIGEQYKNPIASPIQIFYDSSLQVPAEQPVRTINGYVVKNGSVREIFSSEPIVSIVVKNKKGELVWSSPSVNLNPGVTTNAVIDQESGMTQEQLNALFLRSDQNLDDLQDKEAARENLDVYSRTDIDEEFSAKVKDASETDAGIAKVATTSEVSAGTSDNTIITPKKLKAGVANSLNATGDAPIAGIRGYGAFTGSGSKISGVNFESVLQIDTGVYEVTLTTAMSNANYLVFPSLVSGGTDAKSVTVDETFTQTTTKFRLVCNYGGDNSKGRFNPTQVYFHIVG